MLRARKQARQGARAHKAPEKYNPAKLIAATGNSGARYRQIKLRPRCKNQISARFNRERVFSYKTLVQIRPFSLTINIPSQSRGILIVLLFTPLCPGRDIARTSSSTKARANLFFLFTYLQGEGNKNLCCANCMDVKFYIAGPGRVLHLIGKNLGSATRFCAES